MAGPGRSLNNLRSLGSMRLFGRGWSHGERLVVSYGLSPSPCPRFQYPPLVSAPGSCFPALARGQHLLVFGYRVQLGSTVCGEAGSYDWQLAVRQGWAHLSAANCGCWHSYLRCRSYPSLAGFRLCLNRALCLLSPPGAAGVHRSVVAAPSPRLVRQHESGLILMQSEGRQLGVA